MVTFNLNQILTALLLAALIVLVIFLIVLAKNAIQTVKKANLILDDGIEVIDNFKKKYSDIKSIIEKSKIVTVVESGIQFIRALIKKAKAKKAAENEMVDEITE